jgi:hypothetical protein
METIITHYITIHDAIHDYYGWINLKFRENPDENYKLLTEKIEDGTTNLEIIVPSIGTKTYSIYQVTLNEICYYIYKIIKESYSNKTNSLKSISILKVKIKGLTRSIVVYANLTP